MAEEQPPASGRKRRSSDSNMASLDSDEDFDNTVEGGLPRTDMEAGDLETDDDLGNMAMVRSDSSPGTVSPFDQRQISRPPGSLAGREVTEVTADCQQTASGNVNIVASNTSGVVKGIEQHVYQGLHYHIHAPSQRAFEELMRGAVPQLPESSPFPALPPPPPQQPPVDLPERPGPASEIPTLTQTQRLRPPAPQPLPPPRLPVSTPLTVMPPISPPLSQQVASTSTPPAPLQPVASTSTPPALPQEASPPQHQPASTEAILHQILQLLSAVPQTCPGLQPPGPQAGRSLPPQLPPSLERTPGQPTAAPPAPSSSWSLPPAQAASAGAEAEPASGGQGRAAAPVRPPDVDPLPEECRELKNRIANTRQLIARACPQGYVETPALWELLEELEHRGACLVLGLPGHGKTALALQAMDSLAASQHLKPLRLEKPEQWEWIPGEGEDDTSTTERQQQQQQQQKEDFMNENCQGDGHDEELYSRKRRGDTEESLSQQKLKAGSSSGSKSTSVDRPGPHTSKDSHLSDSRRYVVLLDDVFGKGNYDDAKRKAWEDIFDLLLAKVRAGQVKLIIVSRAHIYQTCEKSLGEHALFEHTHKIDLREPDYWTGKAKMEIFQNFLHQYEVQVTTPLEDIVGKSDVCTEIGFPQCCKFFVLNPEAQRESSNFFQHPVRFLQAQLKLHQENDVRLFFVLVLTWLEGGILSIERLSCNNETYLKKLHELSQQFGLREMMTSTEIEARARSLCGVYLCEEVEGVFWFSHQSVHDCLVVAVCKADLKRALHICSVQQLCEYVHTEGSTRGHPGLTYTVRKSQWPLLAARLVKALTSENQIEVLGHPSLQDREFMTELVTKHLQPCHISQVLLEKCSSRIELSHLTGIYTSGFFHAYFDSIQTLTLVAALIESGIPELPRHLLTSAAMASLPDSDRSTLLREALVCACHISDASLVSLLLDRQAPITHDTLRATCASEKEDVSILRAVCQRVPRKELSPEVFQRLLWFCCVRGKVSSLQYVLTEARPQHCQKVLDTVITDLVKTSAMKKYPQLFQILSTLTSAGAIFDKTYFSLHDAASLPDSFALKEFLSEGISTEQLQINREKTSQLESATFKPLRHIQNHFNSRLVSGFGINVRHVEKETLLHASAKSGSLQCLQILLDSPLTSSLDINGLDIEKKSPLYRAVEGNHVTVAAFLLQRGANPDGGVVLPENCDVTDSREVIESNSSSDVGKSVTRDCRMACMATTPLHIAACHHHLSLIELLIRHNARTDVLDYEQRTLLHVYAGSTLTKWRSKDQTEKVLRQRVENLLVEHTNINQQDEHGNTPLHLAARNGQLSLIEALLSNKAKTDMVNIHNRTALHEFAASDDRIGDRKARERVMELLVRSISDINQQDRKQKTAFHIAAERGNLSMMNVLIKHGARLDLVDKRRESVLHSYSMSHYNVCMMEQRRRVEKEIMAGVSNINSPDRKGSSPIHLAASCRNVSLMESLMKHGARVDVVDKKGRTPVHLCATAEAEAQWGLGNKWKTRQRQRVEELMVEKLSVGGKVDINTQNKKGKSALHLAVFSGHMTLIETLLKHGARVDTLDKEGQTPLPVIEILIKHGARVDTLDKQGMTPLHSAWKAQHKETEMKAELRQRVEELMVEKLSVEGKVDINTQDKKGRTPLHLAASSGRVTLIETLIEHGARVDTRKEQGQTPLHLAAHQCCVPGIEILIKHGARVDTRDMQGQTPLHLAVHQGCVPVIEILIKHEATVYTLDKQGMTPLHAYAASWKMHYSETEREAELRQRVGELMVEKLSVGGKVDINTQDKMGRTPLHLAASNGRMTLIETLLRHKARVDMLDQNGQTPLHTYAASWKVYHSETEREAEQIQRLRELMVEKLSVGGEIDINTQDKMGRTPLHLAASSGHMTLIETLIRHKARVDILDQNGQTPLHTYAASWTVWHTESERKTEQRQLVEELMVEKLSVGGEMDINTQDKMGRTPLHLAASSGHMTLIETLIRHKARVDMLDQNGQTPLHTYAASRKVWHSETEREAEQRQRVEELMVEKLSVGGEIGINTQDKEGRTPLHLAASSGHMTLIETLLRHKARVDMLDQNGQTPLHVYAASRKVYHSETEREAEQRQRVEELMVEKLSVGGEVDINIQDKRGETALHLAAGGGKLHLMEVLMKHPVRADLVHKGGMLALHWYALWHPGRLGSAEAQERVKQKLVDSTPDVWVRAPCGCTALDMARRRGNSSLVRALEARAPPQTLHGTDRLEVGRSGSSCVQKLRQEFLGLTF